MSENNQNRDVGHPPDAVAFHLEDLYGKPPEDKDPFEEKPKAPAPVTPAQVPPYTPAVQAGGVGDIEQRLSKARADMTFTVNEVELTLDVVEVMVNEYSICCLVKDSGLRCRIPRSQNVQIRVSGKTYNTSFLGSWHTCEWLGVHVVTFPILPDGTSSNP